MADRNLTTNAPPSKPDKQRYPRPQWMRAIREVLLLRWWILFVLLILYIVVRFSSLKTLLDISDDVNVLINPIWQYDFVSTIVFIFSGAFVALGYWSVNDVEQEGFFAERQRGKLWSERERQQKLEEEKQRKLEEEQPLPLGFKLRHTLVGHTSSIESIAWSPNGQMLASCSCDETIRLWNPQTTQNLRMLKQHNSPVWGAAWSPDGQTFAFCSIDAAIHLWKPQIIHEPQILKGHTNIVLHATWSPDGKTLASCSGDKTIRLWEPQNARELQVLRGHTNAIESIDWSPDGKTLASCSSDKTIRLWDFKTTQEFRMLQGHTSYIIDVTWSPDGQTLASGSFDKTIRLWDFKTGKCIRILEGHTDFVSYIAFSPDGRLLGSKSKDGTVRLWRTDTWENISILYEYSMYSGNLSFHPILPILATLGEKGTAIRVWDLDIDAILGTKYQISSSYTNAKVVLLGDSGVGKSGLGLVLSKQPFALTESTHARRIWNFDRQEVELADKLKETRETLLWDLAGQLGYRLIHQLHLNDVAVALVVFDARSETDPFAGVYHWDRALRQAQRVQGSSALPLKKILVQARVDRGGVSVSPERIQALIDECGFDSYIETSAKEGWHVSDLRDAVCNAIDWDALPKVSSTQLFQKIKAFLIAEKGTGRYLSTVDDLYKLFLKSPDAPVEQENLYAQFETCIGRVEAADLIKRLSFGNLVLLQPELLDAYASALINSIRDEPDGLGSIEEERVRAAKFRMPTDERIKDKELEKWLLITMIEDMLRRELALREEPYLVFPSQSTRENPDLPDPDGKAVIFAFEGPVQNIYATLAVRLSHSGLFRKRALWKNAITYNATVSGMCGMFLHNIGEGRGELTLFFDKTESASEETCFYFEEFVQTHLLRRAIPETVKRRRIFACSECGFVVSDQLLRLRTERQFNWVDCPSCGDQRIMLADREERVMATPSQRVMEMDRAADEQRDREAAKSTIQGKKATMDFDVFLCHHGVDKAAVKKIGEQLKVQGLLPWLDEWELRPGLPWQRALEEQIEHIKTAAVFVGKDGMGPWQKLELEAFLREFVSRGCPVIPVLLDYAPKEPKLPIFLQGMTWVDFRKADPEPMERLIWGITGKHGPGYSHLP